MIERRIRRAVYPGTFDPVTLGHQNLISRAALLFDELVVAVAASEGKAPLMGLDARLAAVRTVCTDHPNVRVEAFSGLLKDFVREEEAGWIVRGVRGAADGEYEARMAGMNHLLMPEVETVLMPAAEDFRFVSSSFVREVARLGEDEYERFVDPRVIPFLRDALGR